MLKIKDLHVEIENPEDKKTPIKILNGLTLELERGQTHALMGPNGSGKSTLAKVLMGDPRYKVTQGKILLNGEDILGLEPNERAQKGIFLSFQNPVEVSGVQIQKFLRQAYNSLHKKSLLSVLEFNKLLKEHSKKLGVDKSFLDRYLNEGFSGGEKKKMEILQLLILNPKLAVLDETDSGLDIDSLKLVARGINTFKSQESDTNIGKGKTVLIITHYKRILEHIKPDRVSIINKGKIVHSGTGELVNKLEEKGYSWIEED